MASQWAGNKQKINISNEQELIGWVWLTFFNFQAKY